MGHCNKKLNIGLVVIGIAFLQLGACTKGQNSTFRGSNKSLDAETKNEEECADCDALPNDEGEVTTTRTITLTNKEADPEPYDFLFVVDNSFSMDAIANQLNTGFQGLKPEEFPKNTRIAVMSTMAGSSSDNYATPLNVQLAPNSHMESVAAYKSEPGFLQLVSADSMGRFRSVLTTEIATVGENSLYEVERRIRLQNAMTVIKGLFPLAGCNPWFSPTDKNENGESCFRAHLQLSLAGGPCEAGLSAVKQFLIRNASKAMFRDATNLNIVFVSDTHDPGCGGTVGEEVFQEIIDHVPTAEEVTDLVKANPSNIGSIRFHAIVPTKATCTGEDSTYDYSYSKAVEKTGGELVDLCETADYEPVVQKIVSRNETSIRFKLPPNVVDVLNVKVNGEEFKDFSVNRKKGYLILNGIDASAKLQVEVECTFS